MHPLPGCTSYYSPLCMLGGGAVRRGEGIWERVRLTPGLGSGEKNVGSMHTLVTTHYLKYAARRVSVLGCRLCWCLQRCCAAAGFAGRA